MRSGPPLIAESSVECTDSLERRTTTTKSISKEKSPLFLLCVKNGHEPNMN